MCWQPFDVCDSYICVWVLYKIRASKDSEYLEIRMPIWTSIYVPVTVLLF